MRIKHFLLFVCLFASEFIAAQDFMMQGWYWDYPKGTWANHLSGKAAQLSSAGFTSLWFPPHAAASSGPNSNGYDPKDLFIGTSMTGLGSLSDIASMTNTLFNAGIDPVADMVYNHRDGGLAEVNPSVEGWIENYNSTKVTNGDLPFPSDRFHCIVPIGGSTGNGAGTYYIKIRSASLHSNFHNRGYKIYVQTNKTGWAGLSDASEIEPNCSGSATPITLGRNFNAALDAFGCMDDEFALTLSASQFNASDTLFVYLNNAAANGIADYSDQYIFELWYNNGSTSTNIQSQVKYRTWTNHSMHSSGRGHMNHTNFRPNGNPTSLNGDKDGMYFFYDYDHTVPSTRDTLNAWTEWNWDFLKVRGVRMDAVKHFDASYISNMLSYMGSKGKNFGMVVGEIYSTNIAEYQTWLAAVGNSNTRVFDFSLRDNLRQACDDSGFDVRNVFESSAVDNGIPSTQVVTFVNNHDFRDDNGFASLAKNNFELGYAFIMTNNQLGIPCVFYPDYYGYPSNGYSYYPSNLAGKQATIDSLIDIHTAYCYGATNRYYLNDFAAPSANYASGSANKSLIYQLEKGNSDVLCAINFGNTPLTVTINLASSIPSGTTFGKVGGAASATQSFVTSGLTATFTVPARSFGVWVQGLAPLPVELVVFQAKLVDDDQAQLNWEIVPSPDLKEFVVERSFDGRTFGAIGTVQANAEKIYSFSDMLKGLDQKQVYYRLKCNDLSGSFSYSPVRIVRLVHKALKLQAFPNPGAQSQVSLQIDSPNEGEALVQYYSSDGKLIYQQQIQLQKGIQSLPITTYTLPKGLCFISITAGSGLTNVVPIHLN